MADDDNLISGLCAVPLLHETHGRRSDLLGFLDRSVLRLIAGDIFSQRAPDALGVARTDDHALQQLSLGAIRENINKVQRELFQIMVNHQQVAVFPLQFLFVRLDLNLPLRGPLLIHLVSPIVFFSRCGTRSRYHSRAEVRSPSEPAEIWVNKWRTSRRSICLAMVPWRRRKWDAFPIDTT